MKSSVCNRQIFLICLISILGFGIFGIANTAVSHVSTGAWLAILLASFAFLIPAIILRTLARRYEGDTLYTYSHKALGKTAGTVISAIFALFYLLFAGLTVSYFSHIVSLWVLPNTSFRLIAAFIVLVCIYALTRNFTSIVRLVSFIGTLAVITVIIVRLVMIFSGEVSNLLPLFEQRIISKGLAGGTLGCAVFFFGMGILALIPQGEHKNGSISAAVLGVLFSAAMLILVCAACMSMLGPLQTGMYTDAMVLAMKAFDISRVTFIQRADIIFIITWTLLILSSVCCTCYIPYVYVKNITSGRWSTVLAAAVCVLIFVTAVIPSGMEQALGLITLLCKTLGIAALFGVPIIILIASGVRHETKK